MDPVPDTKNVARVLRVPSRARVSEVCLGGEKHFKGDIGRLGRVFYHMVRVVYVFLDAAVALDLVRCAGRSG